MSIKIILTDDHTLFRSDIKVLLSRQGDFEVISEVADGLTDVRLVEQMRPDVILLDPDMSAVNGRETPAQILNSNPQQTVMMLTVPEDNDDLARCMRIDARGFLLKNINVDFLLNSIRKAVDGDSVLSPEMTTRPVQSLTFPASLRVDHLLSTFTPREMEVLGYLAAEHSNKVTTCHPELAESTVKVYVQNILRKLNLGDRVQAAVYTMRHKVPQPEGVQAADIRRRTGTPSRYAPKSD